MNDTNARREPATQPATRTVVVEGPNGKREEFEFTIGWDDTVTVLVDGVPLVGVDEDGAGWWPDGEAWERLVFGGTCTERTVMIEGITTEAMWRDLERALGLDLYGLGRWKEWAAGDPKLFTGADNLDAAVAWAREHGLPYEEERNVRYEPATPPASTVPAEHPHAYGDYSDVN